MKKYSVYYRIVFKVLLTFTVFTPHSSSKSFWQRTVMCAAASECILLPSHIKIITSVDRFKAALKAHLFKQHYE